MSLVCACGGRGGGEPPSPAGVFLLQNVTFSVKAATGLLLLVAAAALLL